jgi:hypothetical protein
MMPALDDACLWRRLPFTTCVSFTDALVDACPIAGGGQVGGSDGE